IPKNEDSCRKWLDFCGIDKQVLTSSTKLCSDHFQKEDIINKSKGTMAKPNVVPSIISKKKKLQLKDTGWYNEADDKSLNIVDVKTAESFEFVSVDEDSMEFKETIYIRRVLKIIHASDVLLRLYIFLVMLVTLQCRILIHL
ncbi:uncharacterized protein LOC114933019, partial [Nylanderia fulva]|uniref:uncharacterized protein LOC114933019 n=1 Tax=Nylanderia fulva TaxID=613905 RepID=UPI0010FB7A71